MVVWHYRYMNTHHIRKATCEFDWKTDFANEDVDKMVKIFKETISNVLSN